MQHNQDPRDVREFADMSDNPNNNGFTTSDYFPLKKWDTRDEGIEDERDMRDDWEESTEQGF